jgi:hypothetical protein
VLWTCERESWTSRVCYQGNGCTTGSAGAACDELIVPTLPAPVIDAGTHHYSDVYPAPHPALPTVVSAGGPVLKNPRVVPITFTSDDGGVGRGVDAFCAGLGATPYWSAIGQEYGVGTLSCAPPVHVTRDLPSQVSDSDVEDLLTLLLDGGVTGLEAPSADTVYALVFPRETTLVWGAQSSCADFLGYHSNTSWTEPLIPFIAVAQCPQPGFGPLEGVTFTLSHELIEAATDPLPFGQPAFRWPDEGNPAWGLYAVGEVADLCNVGPDASFQADRFPYRVARSWSNVAARAGNNPCVPAAPGSVYFATVPEQPDTVTYSYFGQSGSGKGIQIPIGQTRTIPLHLFSEAPTADWWISVSAATEGTLDLSLDNQTGNNGDVFNLTITANSVDWQYGAEVFIIASSSTLGSDVHYTFGLVGQ